jgi:hypothetical protein
MFEELSEELSTDRNARGIRRRDVRGRRRRLVLERSLLLDHLRCTCTSLAGDTRRHRV